MKQKEHSKLNYRKLTFNVLTFRIIIPFLNRINDRQTAERERKFFTQKRPFYWLDVSGLTRILYMENVFGFFMQTRILIFRAFLRKRKCTLNVFWPFYCLFLSTNPPRHTIVHFLLFSNIKMQFKEMVLKIFLFPNLTVFLRSRKCKTKIKISQLKCFE
jgi:hypothetical protein